MPVSATRVDTGLHGVYSISSRWGFDFVSGYTVKAIPAGSNMSLEELRKGRYVLDEKQWLTVRIYMRANRRSKTHTHITNTSEFYFSSPSQVFLAWSQPPFAT